MKRGKEEVGQNPEAAHRHGAFWDLSLQLYLVGNIQIAAGFTEGHHNRHIAIFAGHMEGGVAVPVLEIDETSLADESLDDLHLTSSYSEMKSNVSILQQTPGAMSTFTWAHGPGLTFAAPSG